MASHAGWNGPPLTTTTTAADLYRDGIVALVSGLTHADRLLDAALAADPSFALAAVGRAVCRVLGGDPYAPVVPAGAITCGERQHIEVVHAALTGDTGRAGDLRREHLLEYSGDLLVVWLPAMFTRR